MTLKSRIEALTKKMQPHKQIIEVWIQVDDSTWKVTQSGNERYEELEAAYKESEPHIKRIMITYA